MLFRGKPVPRQVLQSIGRMERNRSTEYDIALAAMRYLRQSKYVYGSFDELRTAIPKYHRFSSYDNGSVSYADRPRWYEQLRNIGKHQDGAPYNACQLGIFRWEKGDGLVLVDDDLRKDEYKWFVCLAGRGEDLPMRLLKPCGDLEIIGEVARIIERNASTGRVTLSYVLDAPIVRSYPKIKVVAALRRTSHLAGGVMLSSHDDPVLTIRQRTKSLPVVPVRRGLAFFGDV